jgi:hypothetical protein
MQSGALCRSKTPTDWNNPVACKSPMIAAVADRRGSTTIVCPVMNTASYW